VATVAPITISRPGRIGRFLRHYGEVCAPMCIGFAVGDVVYFWGGWTTWLLRAVQRAA
jgi:hypothetical protein